MNQTRTGISGFTIVRNAEKLGYPCLESVRSAMPLCDEFIINCGDSEDDTHSLCRQLQSEFPEKIKIFQTRWQRENQTGGYQLKFQSDQALSRCQSPWCLYIQADEVLHEADYEKLHLAKQQADLDPRIDGILFEYLHFYGNYHYTIQGRNWYRREVRLFKNHRGIQAFRDAQGFRKEGEAKLAVIGSTARVFHYGYVRSPRSLKVKSSQMDQWWGKAQPEAGTQAEPPICRHVGLKRFQASHPAVMQERVLNQTDLVDPMTQKRPWNWNEAKNAITFVWESLVPYRIGEFRNYHFLSPKDA